jgi:hypothetical protein
MGGRASARSASPPRLDRLVCHCLPIEALHERPEGGLFLVAAAHQVRDTGRAMPEEPTTLVELTRRAFEAPNSGDFDLMLSFYGPDPVWDAERPAGSGR